MLAYVGWKLKDLQRRNLIALILIMLMPYLAERRWHIEEPASGDVPLLSNSLNLAEGLRHSQVQLSIREFVFIYNWQESLFQPSVISLLRQQLIFTNRVLMP